MSLKTDIAKAPPPWHTLVLVGSVSAILLAKFPALDIVDRDATIETFTRRIFPHLISLEVLGWLRLFFTLVIFASSYSFTLPNRGWQQITSYLPKSKLKRNVTIRMTGFRTQLPFTSVSWNLLGVSFALNSAIVFMANYDKADKLPPWLLRAALLIFETAASNALFVACVVRYTIWPRALAGGDTTQLRRPLVLLLHNANVIVVLVEASLLGGLPVRFGHVAVAAFFGIAYILFTWAYACHWVPGEGPQFVYFFLDTTLGTTTTIYLFFLLIILMAFFALFGVMDHILERLGGGPLVHALATVFVASLVCRFRD